MIKGVMLCYFSLNQNSNKFYEVKLLDESTVQCRWGRVGADGVSKISKGGEKEYNSIIKKRLSPSKNYKKVELELLNDDSSHNVNITDVALSQINYLDELSKQIIIDISLCNIHSIVSSTNIKYDDSTGLFKTPLGIITEKSVIRALSILDEIDLILKNNPLLINNQNIDNESLDMLNAEYFILVPTKIKDTTLKENLLFSHENVQYQRNICNMIFETIQSLDDIKAEQEKRKLNALSEINKTKFFNVSISHLSDVDEYNRIVAYFENSKSSKHNWASTHSHISNIFKIDFPNDIEKFIKKSNEINNIKELWHGSGSANILSILSKGLLMPRETPGKITYSMFGKGLYFADVSTKSLQYCDGMYWNNSSAKSTVYMFLSDIALGNTYTPTNSDLDLKLPKGSHSVWAKAGISGDNTKRDKILHDEFIVFDLSQIRLKYLIEIRTPN